MAGKLSHELRTPISVVASSLDNLQHENIDADTQRYVSRARDGVNRLQNLLVRLSEAARIEQSISQAEKKPLNLVSLLDELGQSYAETYPEYTIQFTTSLKEAIISGSADLIAQMLDKLIANACEFASEKTDKIELGLRQQGSQFDISVKNRGPLLPSEMQDSIFNSMVSLREKDSSGSTHLGLGLYIVRLIAEHHSGEASAMNLDDASGVEFKVSIPALSSLS